MFVGERGWGVASAICGSRVSGSSAWERCRSVRFVAPKTSFAASKTPLPEGRAAPEAVVAPPKGVPKAFCGSRSSGCNVLDRCRGVHSDAPEVPVAVPKYH